MKILKKSLGFTIAELVVAIALLGLIGLGTGAYISNAFRDSKTLTSKADIQNSVTALMNKMEVVIKTANIPIGTINGNTFTVNQLENFGTEDDPEIALQYVQFKHEDDTVTVSVKNERTNDAFKKETSYSYIKEMTVHFVTNENSKKNGVDIHIVGEDERFSLSKTIYTRNTKRAIFKPNNPWEPIIPEDSEGNYFYCECIDCSRAVTENGIWCDDCGGEYDYCENDKKHCQKHCNCSNTPGGGGNGDVITETCKCGVGYNCLKTPINADGYCNNCGGGKCDLGYPHCKQCCECRGSGGGDTLYWTVTLKPGFTPTSYANIVHNVENGDSLQLICDWEREGYELIGWKDNKGSEYKRSNYENGEPVITPNSDIEFTAIWEEESITGGSGTGYVTYRVNYWLENANIDDNKDKADKIEAVYNDVIYTRVATDTTTIREDMNIYVKNLVKEISNSKGFSAVTYMIDKYEIYDTGSELKQITYDFGKSSSYTATITYDNNNTVNTVSDKGAKINKEDIISPKKDLVIDLYYERARYELKLVKGTVSLGANDTKSYITEMGILEYNDAKQAYVQQVYSEPLMIKYDQQVILYAKYEENARWHYWGIGMKKYSGTEFNNGIGYAILMPAEDLSLTAWALPESSIIVTYNANGGYVSPSMEFKETGKPYGTLPEPIRNDNYIFRGWQTADGEPVDADTIVPKEDHTLYANWQLRKIKVGLHYNNNFTAYNVIDVEVGSNWDDDGVLPKPNKIGYMFDGWYSNGESDCKKGTTCVKMKGIVRELDNQVVLHAHWNPITVTVTFDPNGGNCSTATQTYTYGEEYTLPTPTKLGYIFDGWKDKSGNVIKKDETFTMTSVVDYTLTATWIYKSKQSIEVTLNANGGKILLSSNGDDTGDALVNKDYAGTVSEQILTYRSGALYGELPKPTRTGYVFKHWCRNEDCINYCNNSIDEKSVVGESDHTLYAKWDLDVGAYVKYIPPEGNFEYDGEKFMPNNNQYWMLLNEVDGQIEIVSAENVKKKNGALQEFAISSVGDSYNTINYICEKYINQLAESARSLNSDDLYGYIVTLLKDSPAICLPARDDRRDFSSGLSEVLVYKADDESVYYDVQNEGKLYYGIIGKIVEAYRKEIIYIYNSKGKSSSSVEYVAGNPPSPSPKLGIRPVVVLNKNVEITGGAGTYENPYTLTLK